MTPRFVLRFCILCLVFMAALPHRADSLSERSIIALTLFITGVAAVSTLYDQE